MQGREVFLDLEGTLINSIDDPTFKNEVIDSILFKSLLEQASNVHLFSWAITNQDDEVKYKFLICAVAERLGVKFKSIVLRDEMFPLFRRRFGMIDFNEFEDLCRSLGKEFVFQFFIRENQEAFSPKPKDFVLVDDMVEATKMLISTKAEHTHILTIPVDRLHDSNV